MPTKKPQTSTSQQQVERLVKQPETLVGAVALTSLGVISMNLWQQSPLINLHFKTSTAQVIVHSDPQATISATVPEASTAAVVATTSATPTATSSAQPTSTPKASTTPKPTATPTTTQIKNGTSTTVTAKPNDTFWTIAKRICGKGIEGYRIQEENGYKIKHLHPGDQIVVTCN